MVDWVFFDIGNVLFNDDRQNFFAYRQTHRAIAKLDSSYTFAQMLADREAHVRDGVNWILHHIARRWMSDDEIRGMMRGIRSQLLPRYDDYNVPHAGSRELLERLHGRYRLGVIANQPAECRESLRRRGLVELFDVIAISEELDLHKPDVQLYEWAIRQADCEPSRTVMIGDRLDNDVAPAGRASMRTIHLRWKDVLARGWEPPDDDARAFLDSCSRIPLFDRSDGDAVPDVTIGSLEELSAALESLTDRPKRGA